METLERRESHNFNGVVCFHVAAVNDHANETAVV